MNRMLGGDPMNAGNYRTQRAESPEDLNQPLYDRANVTTTVPSEVSFFSIGRGQSASLVTGESAAASKTKSYRDTNMDTSNVVPTKLFKFMGVSLAFIHQTKDDANNATDRDLIRDGGYFTFRIVDKDILFLPNVALPELNPYLSVATTVTATSVNGSVGGGGAPMYKFPIPITLNPYENFSVALKFDGTITLNNTLDILCVLHSYMRRPT